MTLADEIAALARQTVPELRQRYAALFGEATVARHKTWLVKRIAWRLQALAEGDLSERARQRALELANDADLRLSPPRTPGAQAGTELRPAKALKNRERLPLPGPILRRPHKGQILEAKLPQEGCQYDGRIYRSLSAVAKAVTGSHCSGLLFFGLAKRGAAS